jgi:addiction module RelE/StbE family toxin
MSPPREFRVIWSPQARDDLDAIADFIGQDNPEVAVSVVTEIRQRAATLCAMPLRGRIVPELKELSRTSYRELVHRLWRIVYEIRGDNVNVLAVLDARRDFVDALRDRLLR